MLFYPASLPLSCQTLDYTAGIIRRHRKLRCCPWRAGQLAKAIHILQTREIGR